jgi:hypothetical protein
MLPGRFFYCTVKQSDLQPNLTPESLFSIIVPQMNDLKDKEREE